MEKLFKYYINEWLPHA